MGSRAFPLAILGAALIASACYSTMAGWREQRTTTIGHFEKVDLRTGGDYGWGRSRSELRYQGRRIEKFVGKILVVPDQPWVAIYGRRGSELIECQAEYKKRCAAIVHFDGRQNLEKVLLSGRSYFRDGTAEEDGEASRFWSPDLTELALDSAGRIYVLSRTETTLLDINREFEDSLDLEARKSAFLSWAPPGKRVAIAVFSSARSSHRLTVLDRQERELYRTEHEVRCDSVSPFETCRLILLDRG